MLKVLTGEATKVCKKNRDRKIQNYYKYAKLKRFRHYCRLQVYMYAFMYVDPEKIPVEDHFTSTK